MTRLGKSLLITAAAYISVDQAIRQTTAAINKSIDAATVQRLRALSDGYDNPTTCCWPPLVRREVQPEPAGIAKPG